MPCTASRAAALLAVVFLFYFNRTKLNIQEQAEAQLTEVTRQYANAIKTDMRGNIQAVEALAHVFGELGQSNPETIIPLITSIAGTLGLKRMGLVTLDGVAHTTDGPTFDARDRLYFKRALTGPPHRRHPARGQDRQQPHQCLCLPHRP